MTDGMQSADEVQLVRRARAGDERALAALLQAHYGAVRRYLLKVTFDRALADDLAQATMVRAIEGFRAFEGRSKVSTWLLGIATRAYLDLLRRRARERRLEPVVDPEALVQRAPDPEARQLLDRLAHLPREAALPLVLKHAYDFTYEEIGAVMDLPAGTVKSRVFHATRTLREGADDGAGD